MNKQRKGRKRMMLLITAALLVCGVLVYAVGYRRTWEKRYPQGEKPLSNPLKGWACWGENLSGWEGTSLAYVGVYWRDIEPTEGCYDFAALEEQWHFAKWAERGVHLVLRVVADEPGDERHMDIPQWLYEAMGGAGTWYDNDYGKGFSPDYESPVFQAAHARLLRALGERYDHDPRVAYVQLGSLGHWGEWHVNTASGIPAFPFSGITDGYVKDYVQAFPHTPLLMRRPYEAVNRYGLGLFDDSFGYERSETRFASWITEGYVSDQNGEALPACPDFWQKGPSGGEFSSAIDLEALLTDDLDRALSYLRFLHTTWLGPHSPRQSKLSAEAWQNAQRLEQEMGYCFTLRRVVLSSRPVGASRLTLDFENIGVAPMYADWKLRVEIRDATGQQVTTWEQDAATSAWRKDGSVRVSLPRLERETAPYTIWIGFVDPMTGRCRIALANQLPEKDGMYCVGTLTAEGALE